MATPASPLANGGAFGGKRRSPVPGHARALADETGRAGSGCSGAARTWCGGAPSDPPLAMALRADGTGVVRVGRTRESADLAPALARSGDRVCPGRRGGGDRRRRAAGRRPTCAVLCGPRCWRRGWRRTTRHSRRAQGTGRADVTLPGAGRARVEVGLRDGPRGRVDVEVWAGALLDAVTLRSYALGAVHQALGLVWSEGIAVERRAGSRST